MRLVTKPGFDTSIKYLASGSNAKKNLPLLPVATSLTYAPFLETEILAPLKFLSPSRTIPSISNL